MCQNEYEAPCAPISRDHAKMKIPRECSCLNAKGPAGGTKHSSGKLFKVKAHHRLIVNLNTRFDGFAG